MASVHKELAYLKQYGRPLHPLQRIRREWVDYQKQSHLRHMECLERYLQVAPDLIPPHLEGKSRPTIRHPDLQPNNIFVSNNLEITGLIDWQHCAVLPLFLQAGIPGSLQNHGDDVSESLVEPRLPEDFDEQQESEQLRQVLLLRKRQLHYTYVVETLRMNPAHGKLLNDHFAVLRRKLFRHASEPWEGDSTALQADLVQLSREWSDNMASKAVCPLTFSNQEASESLQLARSMEEADSQFQSCLEVVGAGPEGWVPTDQYDDARQREQQLRADTFEEAESELERKQIEDHWIFDDFDETEYS